MVVSVKELGVASVLVTRKGGVYRRSEACTNKVVLGAVVTLLNTRRGEFVTYKIVNENEADLKYGKISFASPLAHALIGKFAGQFVNVIAPAGVTYYKICKVEHI